MFDNILGLVKDTVSKNVSNNNIVPDDKKNQTVETTTSALADGLKQNMSLGNMSNLMNLFKGNSAPASNPITSSIQNTVTSSLMEKVGLSQAVAGAVAAAVVPMVMSAIAGKVNDPNEKGFSLESLMHSFSGNDKATDNAESNSNILGSLGKMFGK